MDISKCAGTDCELKKTCFRFTAESSDYQLYQEFWKDDSCDYYLDNKGRDNENSYFSW